MLFRSPESGEPKEFLPTLPDETLTEDYSIIALKRGLNPAHFGPDSGRRHHHRHASGRGIRLPAKFFGRVALAAFCFEFRRTETVRSGDSRESCQGSSSGFGTCGAAQRTSIKRTNSRPTGASCPKHSVASVSLFLSRRRRRQARIEFCGLSKFFLRLLGFALLA